ncbi:MAG: peptidylprolyl isomerase, partial [Ktedonobacterales bacterium]|nr:peptidylprolyl isomerase [Ktedonobacterales bacterium]
MTKPASPPNANTDETPVTRNGARYQPGRSRLKEYRIPGKPEISGQRVDRPIFLGYGRNLTASKRYQLQRRLYFAFAGAVALLIVAVIAFGILNVNVIQPGQPIVTVNGQGIAQRDYKMMVAYLAQDTNNQLQAANAHVTQLQQQIANEKDAAKKTELQTQVSLAQTNVSTQQTGFTQTIIDQLAVDRLVEDQLIRQQIPLLEKSDPKAVGTLNVSKQQVNDALATFKKAFPLGQSFGSFLSKNNLSEDQIRTALGIGLRRTAMTTYLNSGLVSPTLQVHFARIQYDGQSKAVADNAKLAAVTDPAKKLDLWNQLAHSNSLDVNTRDKGGDIGWAVRGQQDQGLENWLFAKDRKVGDYSAPVKEVSGTWDLLRIVEIDPARAVDATTLSNLKTNALDHWLTGLRNLPPTDHISSTNQDMFNDAGNQP